MCSALLDVDAQVLSPGRYQSMLAADGDMHAWTAMVEQCNRELKQASLAPLVARY